MTGGQGLNPQGLGGSENVGSSESKTSTTDRAFVGSNGMRVNVWKDGDTIKAGGPTGVVAEGTDLNAVLQTTLDEFDLGNAHPNGVRVLLNNDPDSTATSPATFEYSTSLDARVSGVYIEGLGPATTRIKQADGANADFLTYSDTSNSMFWTLKNIRFDGNKANNTSGSVINTTSSDFIDLKTENLYVAHWPDWGIKLKTGWGWVDHASVYEDCGGDAAIKVDASADAKIIGAKVLDNPRFGIWLSNNSSKLIGCFVSKSGQDNLRLAGDHHTITGGEIREAGTDSSGSYHNINDYGVGTVISGVTIDGASQSKHAINLQTNNAQDTRISGCDMYGHTSTPINNYKAVPRALIDGRGYNSGDPSSTGDWNGNGREGVAVYDTSVARPYTEYQYIDGAWQSA